MRSDYNTYSAFMWLVQVMTSLLDHTQDKHASHLTWSLCVLCSRSGFIVHQSRQKSFRIRMIINILSAIVTITKDLTSTHLMHTLHAHWLSQPFPNFLTDDPESKNVFSIEGEAWRKMRRTLSPSFSASKIKMVHIINSILKYRN